LKSRHHRTVVFRRPGSATSMPRQKLGALRPPMALVS
jgi:hypothetical protein